MTQLEATGTNGNVLEDDNCVTTTRTSFRGKVLHGHGFDEEERIVIPSITAVQFKAVGKLGHYMTSQFNKKQTLTTASGATGYIQFVVPGSQVSKRGLYAVQFDENAVLFNGAAEAHFVAVRDFVKLRIVQLTRGAPLSASAVDIAQQQKAFCP
jgi:hypothetical protein